MAIRQAQKKSFLLRLDPDLWADLQAWAGDELRSVNGQIEWVLRQALQARGRGEARRRFPSGSRGEGGPDIT